MQFYLKYDYQSTKLWQQNHSTTIRSTNQNQTQQQTREDQPQDRARRLPQGAALLPGVRLCGRIQVHPEAPPEGPQVEEVQGSYPGHGC